MQAMKKKVVALLIILGVVIGLSPFLLRVHADGNILTVSQLTTTEVRNIDDYVNLVNEKIRDNPDIHLYGLSQWYDEEGNLVDASDLHTDVIDILEWKEDSAGGTASGKMVYTLKFDSATYQKLDTKDKTVLMDILLTNLDEDSNVSAINRTKIYNFIAGNDEATAGLVRQLSTDMKSDYASAYMWIKPFSGPIGMFMGIIVVIIFATLSLSIVIDIGYITIPFFQVILHESNGQDKPKLVSVEAVAAIKSSESTTGDNYKSPTSYYFGYKSKQFVTLAICILYLTSGKIYSVISYIMNLVSGAMG